MSSPASCGVGQTYFFTWLDGRFTDMMNHASENKADNHVWMVHSGGFYIVDKQKKPQLMPGKLHWFKWEAAITWLSGITLIILVYYTGGLMVDENMDPTIRLLSASVRLFLDGLYMTCCGV